MSEIRTVEIEKARREIVLSALALASAEIENDWSTTEQVWHYDSCHDRFNDALDAYVVAVTS